MGALRLTLRAELRRRWPARAAARVRPAVVLRAE
jgi:hypothetical protein